MIERFGMGPRMSQVVAHGDTVYTAGHVAADTSADVAGQTRDILARLEVALAKAGSDKTKILSATIWLADISTFDQMNGVWDPWVSKEAPPARACVQAKLAGPQYLVEIALVAAR